MKRKHEDHLIESHKEKHEEKHEEEHEEKHEEKHREKHEEKHEEKHDEKHEEKHKDCLIEDHDEKTWRSFDFDRESWQKNMIESHEEESCRQFNQAIYIYLISCRVKSSFRVELLSQASQLNSTLFQKNFNSTQHFSSRVLNLTRSV